MGGGGGADEAAEDAALFGMDISDADLLNPEFSVLPENWDTLRAFCAIQTQWRYAASGHITGLDYAGVRVAIKSLGLKFKDVFAGVQIMESEVLDAQRH